MTQPGPVAFPHERLDVYATSLAFVSLSHKVIARMPRGHAALADQLGRAATSIVLNTAEGSGEFSRREKARFYRMALRSAAESSAVLDVAARQGVASESHVREGKELLARTAAMLTALIRNQAREESRGEGR